MNIEGIESEVDYVLKSLSMTESDPDKEAEIHAVHEKAMNMISDFKKRMGEDKNEPIEAMMGATPDDGNSPIEEREMRNILRRSGRNRLMRIFLVSAALFGVPFVAWGVVSLGIALEALSEDTLMRPFIAGIVAVFASYLSGLVDGGEQKHAARKNKAITADDLFRGASRRIRELRIKQGLTVTEVSKA